MGLACCIAAKDTTLPSQTSTEAIHRGVIYSPSWSFRWDNRRRVAGEIDDRPEGNLGHPQVPTKEYFRQGRGYVSDGRSQVANMGTPISQRSPVHDVVGARSLTLSSDLSCRSNNSTELKSVPSPESAVPKKSFASTLSSFPKPRAETLSVNIDSFPPNPASSLGQLSPVHQLLGEISEGQTPERKSPCRNSISEGRPSFVFSPHRNGFTTGSQGGFSDGWSMRTFSELVASSQRERWSFESEQLSCVYGEMSESSSKFSCSPSFESQTCAACMKLLTERASSSCRGNEISVAAVLVCGHLYHGECLEILTQDKDRYDPICPVCTMGEKQMLKMCKKALKAEAERKSRSCKIFKKRAVDGFFSGELKSFGYGKTTRSEASSSSKPFLSRHFSLQSKWGRSVSVNDSARKKSFWSRSRKE
ncbi:hypothetical protein MLD38_002104 [Melastoma candidum]|uniref:Uncharacterized protein n=1 Tax=Melastoma candidum TaxID=119954 RepID=A0ACB9SFD4_9MYRT|nr:hypothetical protein MLD38_002104 [Melastoma candidum]